MTRLETPRLTLRLFSEDDLDDYAAMMADAEVTRYVPPGPVSRVDAWRQLAVILGHWQLRGYGPWAAIERTSGRFVGRIGFFNPEGWPGFELGWVLARDDWGRGFALEGARAALDYAFSTLNQDHVISLIHAENGRSIRVAERLGMTLERSLHMFGIEVLQYGTAAGARGPDGPLRAG